VRNKLTAEGRRRRGLLSSCTNIDFGERSIKARRICWRGRFWACDERVKEWRMMTVWMITEINWADKWMKSQVETWLARLTEWIWELIPETVWCIWAICDFQWRDVSRLPLAPLADVSVATGDGFGAGRGSLSPTSSVTDLRPNRVWNSGLILSFFSSFLLNVKMGSWERPLQDAPGWGLTIVHLSFFFLV